MTDNPPAFPFTEQGMSSFSGQTVDIVNPGMTLRDYFAAKALQAMATRSDMDGVAYDKLAAYAYDYADAMLAERSKSEAAQ
jgi:hypothetical protein